MTSDPSAPIAWRAGEPVTRARFFDEAEQLADALPEAGCAINLCRDRYLFTLAFVAVGLRGQTNLLPSSESSALIEQMRVAYAPTIEITDQWIADAMRAAPPRRPVPRRQIDPAHIVAIAFTSGSSGPSQPHPKTWATLVATARLSAATLMPESSTHIVATVPPQHMYGLEFSVMVPLVTRGAADSRRPFYARDVAAALTQVPAPRVLVTTPLHLRALLATGIALPPVAAVLSATAPLDADLAATAEATLRCGVREIYGCTEAGSVATRRPLESLAWRPHRGSRVRICDGRTLLEGAHLPGVVELADRVQLDADGSFGLLGRDADLLKVAGKRASLADLNRRLLAIPGVHDGVMFLPTADESARPAALVVAPSLSVAAMLERLATEMDPVFLPRPLRKVECLPRDALGKLPLESLCALLHRCDE